MISVRNLLIDFCLPDAASYGPLPTRAPFASRRATNPLVVPVAYAVSSTAGSPICMIEDTIMRTPPRSPHPDPPANGSCVLPPVVRDQVTCHRNEAMRHHDHACVLGLVPNVPRLADGMAASQLAVDWRSWHGRQPALARWRPTGPVPTDRSRMSLRAYGLRPQPLTPRPPLASRRTPASPRGRSGAGSSREPAGPLSSTCATPAARSVSSFARDLVRRAEHRAFRRGVERVVERQHAGFAPSPGAAASLVMRCWLASRASTAFALVGGVLRHIEGARDADIHRIEAPPAASTSAW